MLGGDITLIVAVNLIAKEMCGYQKVNILLQIGNVDADGVFRLRLCFQSITA